MTNSELIGKVYCLLRWRNKLVAQGKYAAPINDLLCKMFTC